MQFSNKRLLNHSQRLRRLRYLAIAFLLFLLLPLGTILYLGFHQLEKDSLIDSANCKQIGANSRWKSDQKKIDI